MINIIETKTYRHIELINILMSQENSVSIQKISTRLNVSDLTIISDIEYLNEIYSDLLFINKNNSKNLLIENSSTSKLNYVQSLLLNGSKNIQFLTKLLLNPFEKIKTYSTMIDVSSSYLYKSVDQINISLAPYKIKIHSVNNKYFINGDSEILLRKLFSIFLAETNIYTSDILFNQENDFDLLKKEITSDIFLELKIFQPYYFLYFFLSNKRNEQGFHIISIDYKETEPQYNDNELLIIDSIKYSPYRNNLFYYNRNFYSLYDYLKNLDNQDNKQFKLLFELICRIYENETSYQIPPTLFLNKLNFFYYALKERKHLYSPIKKIINDISAIIRLDLKEYEIILSYVLAVHFSHLLSFNIKDSILIVSKLSLYHAEFLKSFFTNKFKNYCSFVIVQNKEMIRKTNNSTIFITNDPMLDKDNKIIINDYPTRADVNHVKQKISQLYS